MLRFCLIGTGRAGLVHATNIDHRIKHAQLVVLCDADPGALQRAAAEYEVCRRYRDYREAIRDPQVAAVVVATPAALHCEIACEAAAQGKHIFLEKPMALSVAECEQINTAVQRAGVTLQIGFMRRFDSAFVQAKEMLGSGDLGRVMIIKSTGRGPGLPPAWIYDIGKSNGILAEVNSHDFDSVRWLVGSEIVRVFAEAVNVQCEDARERYPDFYDNAVVALRFADDTLGSIDGTCPAHYGYDARVEVLCEKGALFIGSVQNRGVSRVTLAGSVVTSAVESWRSLFKDAYIAEMEHFVTCVEQGASPRATGLDGLRAVEAVVAANKSIASGEPVSLEGIRQA
jgi:myo-inositol 2-dehydrogenase/D-chiro-inositol 1-dehydrogenase/scyllo-inositol 2-dehydrogenase (NAD+)